MFCSKCGAEIAQGHMFCIKCGTKVELGTEDNISAGETNVQAEAQPSAQEGQAKQEVQLGKTPEQGNAGQTSPEGVSLPQSPAAAASAGMTTVVKRKHIALWKIPAALAITAVVGCGVFFGGKAALDHHKQTQVREHILEAQHYLEELDYENAVLAYEAAIELDPMNIDAYLGLADAYYHLEDYDHAIDACKDVLDIDEENTTALLGMGDAYLALEDYDKAIRTYEDLLELDGNNALAWLRLAEAYRQNGEYDKAEECYREALERDPHLAEIYPALADLYIYKGDYEKALEILDDGIAETDSDELREKKEETEELRDAAMVNLFGTVVEGDEDLNFANNPPMEGVSVTLEGISRPYLARTETDESGEYEFECILPGEYSITIEERGYLTVEQTLNVQAEEGDFYNSTVELLSEAHVGNGTASGMVYDAYSGAGVDGLTIYIREGLNQINGEPVAVTQTEQGGYYQTPSLPSGNYTIEVEDERGQSTVYVGTAVNIKILGNMDIGEQNATVTTVLNDGELRIVLSWGATPTDLDSHLDCCMENGYGHVYYGNSNVYLNYNGVSEYIAGLDLDDVTSYGPETVTIYTDKPGQFVYGVYDFSHGSVTDIRDSGAVVQVYSGTSIIPDYTFYAPMLNGYYWEVFSYDNSTGVLTPINTLSEDYSYQGQGGGYGYEEPAYQSMYSEEFLQEIGQAAYDYYRYYYGIRERDYHLSFGVYEDIYDGSIDVLIEGYEVLEDGSEGAYVAPVQYILNPDGTGMEYLRDDNGITAGQREVDISYYMN